MDAQYFIDKFEAIPEEKWAINVLQTIDGRRCAIGHCLGSRLPEGVVLTVLSSGSLNDEVRVLQNLFRDHLCFGIVVKVNDGTDPRYQQETPKQRILAALRDIKTKEDEEKAVQEVKNMLEIPICPECGKLVTICDCEEEDFDEEEEEDWGAGEAFKSGVLKEPCLEY